MTVPTNRHCGNCISKLVIVLDSQPSVHRWKTDVLLPEKPVTVHGTISQVQLIRLVERAGFEAKTGPAVACKMRTTAVAEQERNFWADKKVWRHSSINTFNGLLGCAVGEFGMVICLQVFHLGTPMWLQMLLAITAGLITSSLLETTLLHVKEKLVWKAALKMALSMSLISMIGMEIVMNAIYFMITGGNAQLTSVPYWLAFIPAAVAGFLAPLPYNNYQLKNHNRALY